jgi:hypothetical protein
MGAQEEAFIHFVIITDLLCYHFSALSTLSILLKSFPRPCLIDCKLLSDLLNSYQGARSLTKQEKGFWDTDISFYQTIKARVIKECKLMNTGLSNKDITLDSPNNVSCTPFIFHYPHSSIHVKVEGSSSGSTNKKRKLTRDFALSEVTNKPVESLAMSLDDDDYIDVRFQGDCHQV